MRGMDQGPSEPGMKKPSDEGLGMNEGITRRDFLNSTLIASGAALLGSAAPSEVFGQPQDDDWTGYGGVRDYANSNGNKSDFVTVTYTCDGKLYRVNARSAIMAGGCWTTKHIVSSEMHIGSSIARPA